jgi:hypothetical protein
MDSFERQYLVCSSDDHTPIVSPLRGLAFVPVSVVRRGAVCTLVAVQGALAAYPGVQAVREGAMRGLFEWRRGERWIIVDVRGAGEPVRDPTTGRELWRGSSLEASCTFLDVLGLWRALASACPLARFCDEDQRLYSPSAFVEELAWPELQPAFEATDPAVRERAAREGTRYLDLLATFPAWG